jgi:hypothetical protein
MTRGRASLLRSGFLLVAFLSLGAATLFAHHGRGALYSDKEIAIKGVVKEVSWRNPHIEIVIDASDAKGKAVRWRIEHTNIGALSRLGYNSQSLMPGWQVTAVINPGAKGEPIGFCKKIILADGKEIFELVEDSIDQLLR